MSPEKPALCAGCGGKISDRYYLLAVDKQWHLRCLKCCECKLALESELTCFAKDGSIYCKEDYYRYSDQFSRVQNHAPSPGITNRTALFFRTGSSRSSFLRPATPSRVPSEKSRTITHRAGGRGSRARGGTGRGERAEPRAPPLRLSAGTQPAARRKVSLRPPRSASPARSGRRAANSGDARTVRGRAPRPAPRRRRPGPTGSRLHERFGFPGALIPASSPPRPFWSLNDRKEGGASFSLRPRFSPRRTT